MSKGQPPVPQKGEFGRAAQLGHVHDRVVASIAVEIEPPDGFLDILRQCPARIAAISTVGLELLREERPEIIGEGRPLGDRRSKYAKQGETSLRRSHAL